MNELLRITLGLVPVFLFLVALFALDSFKLVSASFLVRAIATGGVVAAACLVLADRVIGSGALDPTTYLRYVAPLLEELGKALYLVYLIKARRIGFMVDAAILGFAVGAGFAAVENLYYLSTVPDANLLLWAVRGFGTAVMHGGATAIVAISSKLLFDVRESGRLTLFVPGLAIAVLAHGLFNHFALPPVAFTLALVASFPILVFAVFARSEALLRRWLDVGFGSDVDLLDMLRSGEVKDTKVGMYVRTLRDRFPGEVLADMLCYLQLWVELSIKAKGRLLLQEAGFQAPPDPVVADRLEELSFLERSIGATGRLALAPFLRRSSREEWGLEMLKQSALR
jgi:RsiW-degrading membrane proteinase PrsW (M82 family)